MVPSTSYEVQVNLDHNLHPIAVEERNLSWVHGTIVQEKKPQFVGEVLQAPDIRLNITTADPLIPSSDLYQFAMSEENIAPISVRDGKPVIARHLSNKQKSSVSMVRHIEHCELFTDGQVDASVVTGHIYTGKDLELSRPVCEVSLYFNAKSLREAITGFLDSEKIYKFTKKFMSASVQLAEAIEREAGKLAE